VKSTCFDRKYRTARVTGYLNLATALFLSRQAGNSHRKGIRLPFIQKPVDTDGLLYQVAIYFHRLVHRLVILSFSASDL
jgi:hypothetical protein